MTKTQEQGYLAGQTRLILGQAEADSRRRQRAEYYHWQAADLRKRLAVYEGILSGDFGSLAMGRRYYTLRAAMIRNELKMRERGWPE